MLGWNNGRFWEVPNSEGNPVTENFTLVSLGLVLPWRDLIVRRGLALLCILLVRKKTT